MKILIISTYRNLAKYAEELERFHFDYQDERHTKATVKIKSLDDLIEINQLTNQELIIDFRKNSFSGEPFIEIYDGWRE